MPTERVAPQQSLIDVLDRVLDKGLVIAGDIKINLANVELLTIQVRLLVCSIDKAEQIGLDWWKYDRHLSPGARDGVPDDVRKQIKDLERKVALLSGSPTALPAARRRTPRKPEAGG